MEQPKAKWYLPFFPVGYVILSSMSISLQGKIDRNSAIPALILWGVWFLLGMVIGETVLKVAIKNMI